MFKKWRINNCGSQLLFLFYILCIVFQPNILHAVEKEKLYCAGDYGSFYSLDRRQLEIVHISRYGDTLAYLSTLGNTGMEISDPVDMQYQSPDRLLILDAQQRQFIQFSRELDFISNFGIPQQIISPRQFCLDPDRNFVIYDDFHQQLYRISQGKSESFGEADILFGSMDRNMDLIYHGHILYLYLPGEGKMIKFDQYGTLEAEVELPAAISGPEWSCLPSTKGNLFFYRADKLVQYAASREIIREIEANVLIWMNIYMNRLYLIEGKETATLRSLPLQAR